MSLSGIEQWSASCITAEDVSPVGQTDLQTEYFVREKYTSVWNYVLSVKECILSSYPPHSTTCDVLSAVITDTDLILYLYFVFQLLLSLVHVQIMSNSAFYNVWHTHFPLLE